MGGTSPEEDQSSCTAEASLLMVSTLEFVHWTPG